MPDKPRNMLTYNDQTLSLSEWAAITGVKFHTIYGRYRKDWTAGEILGFEPPPKVKAKTPSTRDLMEVRPTHTPSTVYAIQNGKPVELKRQPAWMVERCQ